MGDSQMASFAMILLTLLSVLLTLVILIQRGRGAGLAGAFGGGGQSAFGTKAGDIFTKITIVLITVWVLLAGVTGKLMRSETQLFKNDAAAVDTEKKPSADSKEKKPGEAEVEDFGSDLKMPDFKIPELDKPRTDSQDDRDKDAALKDKKPAGEPSVKPVEPDSKPKEPASKVDEAAKPKVEPATEAPEKTKDEPTEKPKGEAAEKPKNEAAEKPKVETPAKE